MPDLFGGYTGADNTDWFDGVGGFSYSMGSSGASPLGGGTTFDWDGYINRGFDLASQAIARGGKYPTQQDSWNSQFGSPYGYSGGNMGALGQQQLTAQQQAALLAAQRNGGIAEGTASSIGRFISQNPTTTLLLAGGALLLFMKPPGRRG